MKRVLIVDDNSAVISVTAAILKLSGYTTFCVDSGISALSILEQDPDFDLILSDVFMSRMNGFALLQHVRTQYPHIPVLLTSANAQPDTLKKVSDSGAQGFLPRPFTKNELLVAVNHCLNQAAIH